MVVVKRCVYFKSREVELVAWSTVFEKVPIKWLFSRLDRLATIVKIMLVLRRAAVVLLSGIFE